MPIRTDPAQELDLLCRRLAKDASERGSVVIGTVFGVEPWSAEFHAIIGAVIERTSEIERMMIAAGANDHSLAAARKTFSDIRSAITGPSLSTIWKERGAPTLRAASPQLALLSAFVGANYSYDMPNDAEQNELLELLGTLLGWLRGIQLKDRDFIRGSLIDGLERFEFRLRHIHWFGWDYAAASLREVIAAYLVLEKVTPTLSNPDAEAVLMKIGGFFKRMDGIVSGAKDIHEKADWVLQVSTWAFRGLVGTGGAALAGLLN